MGPRGQEPNESTDDAVWQDLVARLEGTPTDPDRPEPPPVGGHHDGTSDAVRFTDDAPGETPDAAAGTTSRERAEAIFRNQPFRSTGPRDHVAPDDQDDPDEDGGFTPEDPPPIGSGEPLTVLAWIGAAGGPIMLFLIAMFWRTAPMTVTLGLLAAFLAGAGYLVTKLPKHRDVGDDGAEV
ncbi:hypothetical protein [Arthrobacter sp. TMS2-4]